MNGGHIKYTTRLLAFMADDPSFVMGSESSLKHRRTLKNVANYRLVTLSGEFGDSTKMLSKCVA
jgi:hypothetical protein